MHEPRPEADPFGPFASGAERNAALRLGMFVFLGSETLLFAGLFALYAGYRAEFPATFARAVRLNETWLGSTNTLILLTSSALVAWSEVALERRRGGRARLALLGGGLLGAAFLGLKALEYGEHFARGIWPGSAYRFAGLSAPGAPVFFTLYYLMTALHALHVIAGLAALAWITVRIQRHPDAPSLPTQLALTALYWHLVDIVWIFLWPLLYLLH